MEQYYEEAIELAGFYNQCNGVSTIPHVPVSNMFHVHFQAPKEEMEIILAEIYTESEIGLSGYVREVREETSYFEISIGDLYETVPREKLINAFKLLDKKMKNRNQ